MMSAIDPIDIEEARKYSSATFHEASGKRGALPSAIKPISPTLQSVAQLSRFCRLRRTIYGYIERSMKPNQAMCS